MWQWNPTDAAMPYCSGQLAVYGMRGSLYRICRDPCSMICVYVELTHAHWGEVVLWLWIGLDLEFHTLTPVHLMNLLDLDLFTLDFDGIWWWKSDSKNSSGICLFFQWLWLCLWQWIFWTNMQQACGFGGNWMGWKLQEDERLLTSFQIPQARVGRGVDIVFQETDIEGGRLRCNQKKNLWKNPQFVPDTV